MENYVITYNNVERKAYDEIADLCSDYEKNRSYATYVIVEYNGNQFKGQLRIEVRGSEGEIYKVMLRRVTEILMKY